MKILVTTFVCSLMLLVSTASLAEVRYVKESLSVNMRSGSTDRYRVIGQVVSGEPLEAFESSGTYTRVRTEDGKTGWVKSDFITAEKSTRALLTEANATIDQQLNEITQLKRRMGDVQSINKLNSELQVQVSRLETENAALRQQNSRLEDRFRTDFFYAGALVLGSGLLVGWILTRFMMRRRRQPGWR